MGAQRLNFALKFHQNGVFSFSLSGQKLSDEGFPTAHNLGGLHGILCHDATKYVAVPQKRFEIERRLRLLLRCVFTPRVKARGRSQMYLLFQGEVALGLGIG